MPPIVAKELALKSRILSRTAEGTQETMIYELNTDDPEIAFLMAPPHNYPRAGASNLRVSEVRTEPRDGMSEVTVVYKELPLELTVGGELWEWDIAGQQQHITSVINSNYQIHYPETASEVGVAIGYNGESVEGVDVYRTTTSLRIVKTWPSIDIYDRNLLQAINCTVNQYPWFDYDAGEVLFLGSKIRQVATGEVQIEYNFLISKFQPPKEVEIIDGTTVIVEPWPWDHIWFRSTEKIVTDEETGKKKKKRGIRSIHIARVYEFQDFSVFGFTGPFG